VTQIKLNAVSVGLVLAATAVFVFCLLLPGSQGLRERQERLTAELSEVEQMRQDVGDVSRLYASIVSLNEEVSTFRRRLPVKRQLGDLLSDLSECLEAAAIKNLTIQPRKMMRVDGPQLPAELELAAGTVIVPVNVSFESEVSVAMSFLECLESLDRIVHVESAQWANSEQTPGWTSVDVVVHAYYQPTK